MNKADLIDAVAAKTAADKKSAGVIVEAMVDTVLRAVASGERVAITGFGVFEKRERAARTARNPRTGVAIRLKKTSVPAFRPGQGFKDVVSGAKRLTKTTTAKRTSSAATKSAATAAPTKKAAAKTLAKKAPAAQAPAKKTAAKKLATKAPAKKAPAKKAPAKKAPAKKAPAKTAAKASKASKATKATKATKSARGKK